MSVYPKLLVVNPNSSTEMTADIEVNISRYFKLKKQPEFLNYISFYTGSSEAPKQISGNETSLLSLNTCLPELTDPNGKYYYNNFDGVLIACFSDHPLVNALAMEAKEANNDTVIVGLLNTSISYCSLFQTKTFSVLTSNNEWKTILDESIEGKYLTNASKPLWKGTVPTNLDVLDLHDQNNYKAIADIIRSKNLGELKSNLIILGCAGFSSIHTKLQQTFKDDLTVEFIEPVTIGIETLVYLCNGFL
ncbi:similar to Saccharomyces cerevisiae YIR030C DCG1 Protein of unknown function, expression is sensitive to nitrogen catabolite repression and regulated by Dal80p [Maudiozyma barnettii]|uniref:Uncharacterized protein n=1 Tax=Maudiozyma barnettii TaxID=61262 RepID=A0A8H2ZKH8_9SACH|nr:Dcg1p [Kazachstania barnettii]CAB4255202.1 similar to Saccharomyces cerevisiae YIR030C DCG1 Protein of unknown function, expression is sensitive to nitrogen catabolite repression and regulated by Dal80p [Kazachstania barnettii]CAD1783493.1 similar to Saccharomyces cerevisiae YIR030C DCG1 Protein of unknown function, expression is sensitive to nitrogen catabolite repression and regulated by Dal80p [Kazachstania barnettii]